MTYTFTGRRGEYAGSMNRHWKHTCDSEGPDPYEIAPGFKQLPAYPCRLCENKTHSDKEASRFQDDLGIWDDYKPICFRCADLVDGMTDWKVL